MTHRPKLLVFNQYYWPGVEATAHLLHHLTTTAAPKDRDVERQRARERNAVRFGTPA